MYNKGDNHIDELFRSAFMGHEEIPPASAWKNIVEKRSFGHILLNQIALNWKNFLFMTIGFMGIGAAIVSIGTPNKKEATAYQSMNTHYNLYNGHEYGGMLLAYNEPNGEVVKESISSYYNNALTSPFNSKTTTKLASPSKRSSRNGKKQYTNNTHKVIGPFNSIETDNTGANDNVTNYATANTQKHSNKVAKNYAEAQREINHSSEVLTSAIDDQSSLSTKLNLGVVQKLTSFKTRRIREELDYEMIAVDSLYFNKTMKKRFPLKNHLSASFKFGPEFMNKELTNATDESAAYLNRRIQSESTLIGGNIQANLAYYFYNNVFVETGFRYSQLREQVNYSQTRILSETTVYDSTVAGFIVGPTGEPIPIYDINSRIEYDKEFIQRNNTNAYHMLAIPILLGYQVDFYKISVHLKSGVSANVFTKNTGSILSEDTDNEIALGSNNDPFKPGISLNLELAGGVSYQIDENFSLLVEPSFRSSLSNLYKGDYPLIEKRKIIGINTGIRIRL